MALHKHFFLITFSLTISGYAFSQNINKIFEDASMEINLPSNSGIVNINKPAILIDEKLISDLVESRKKLIQNKEKLKERIKSYPNDNSFREELKIINIEIEKIENEIEKIKNNFLNKYEFFSTLNISNERTKLVKLFFDKGELKKADSILKIGELTTEQKKIKETRLRKQKELDYIDQKLSDNAYNFFTKAKIIYLTDTFQSKLDLISNYYELSLKSKNSESVLFFYALFLNEYEQYSKSISYYNKANFEYKKLILSGNKYFYKNVITISNNLGNIYSSLKDFKSAETCFNEALAIYRDSANKNPNEFKNDLKLALINLGTFHYNLKQFDKVELVLKEALEISKDLLILTDKDKITELIGILIDLHNAAGTNKDFDKAIKYCLELTELFTKIPKENINLYLPTIISVNKMLGNNYIVKQDYKNAEFFLEKAVSILKLLNKVDDKYSISLAECLSDYGRLFERKEEYLKAEQNYLEALEVLKNLEKSEPKKKAYTIAILQLNLSWVYIKLGKLEKVNSYISDAIEFFVQNNNDDISKLYFKVCINILKMIYINPKEYLSKTFPNKPELLLNLN